MRLILAASLLISVPAFAQTAAPVAEPAATSRLSVDLPIETIAADPAGKAVLDANFPGMTAHAMYDSFKSMTLVQVQPMSNGAVTDASLAKTKTELAAIK